MLRNIKLAIDVIAGAEGYELVSLEASHVGSIPIVNSDGRVVAMRGSDMEQIVLILKKKEQREVCDD